MEFEQDHLFEPQLVLAREPSDPRVEDAYRRIRGETSARIADKAFKLRFGGVR